MTFTTNSAESSKWSFCLFVLAPHGLKYPPFQKAHDQPDWMSACDTSRMTKRILQECSSYEVQRKHVANTYTSSREAVCWIYTNTSWPPITSEWYKLTSENDWRRLVCKISGYKKKLIVAASILYKVLRRGWPDGMGKERQWSWSKRLRTEQSGETCLRASARIKHNQGLDEDM